MRCLTSGLLSVGLGTAICMKKKHGKRGWGTDIWLTEASLRVASQSRNWNIIWSSCVAHHACQKA
eukprot:2096821-Rhodomonas_salina.3